MNLLYLFSYNTIDPNNGKEMLYLCIKLFSWYVILLTKLNEVQIYKQDFWKFMENIYSERTVDFKNAFQKKDPSH